ncbi:MAG: HAD family phosphatase [Melioribacteraceae bacterium]|nr:HAD family phosphatase [Melioribacteraceae bacterium]
MKKFILFDNDGILVDTEKYYLKANQEVLADLNINLTHEDYKRISLQQGRSVLEMAAELGFDPENLLLLRDKRDKIYEEYIFSKNLLLPGVKETLNLLKEFFRFGVVTSTRRGYFRKLHETTGLLDLFDFVVAREDYINSKPDPEPYLKGIRKSDCNKEEIIAIEDSPRGLLSANRAGLACIIIPNELTRDCYFENYELRLNTFSDLTPEVLVNM